MNQFLKIFIASALFFGTAVQEGQAQANMTARAFAEVIAALTATENSQLNFGRFSSEEQGGQIYLSPQGVRHATGALVLSGGEFSPAAFYITGASEASFSISLPSGPAVLTNVSNSKSMVVSDWESIPSAGLGTGKLEGGSLAVNIGATLTVGSMNDNPVGIYTGTYAITFSYN